MVTMRRTVVASICAFYLAACGGTGEDPSPGGESSSSSSSSTTSSSSSSNSSSSSSSSSGMSSSGMSSSGMSAQQAVRIQAQDYADFNESGDTRDGDTSGPCGVGAVDMSANDDLDGVCNIGWAVAGEWTEYTVSGLQAGAYNITLRIASAKAGQTVRVDVDGSSVGAVSTDGQGWGAYTFETITNVDLGGSHTIRVNFIDGSVNFNFMDIVPVNISGSSASSSSTSGSASFSRGKDIWELNCTNSNCHSGGAVQGTFLESKLVANNLFDQVDLVQYIEESMPFGKAAECVGACAADVTSYIMSWHSLPLDPGTATGKPGEIDNPVEPLACTTANSRGLRVLRVLTGKQYQNTVRDLFGYTDDITNSLPTDERIGRFVNNNGAIVSKPAYDEYLGAAEKVANAAKANNFKPLLSCSSFNQACAETFVNQAATRIFRRPLTNAERTGYLAVANGSKTDGNVKDGITLAVQGMLSAPQFLYRHEIGSDQGGGVFKLDAYELATYMAYALTGTTPDAELLQAAKDNQLNTNAQIETQAQRLLDTDGAKSIFGDVVHEWLGTDRIREINKDDAVFANFEQISQHLERELSLVFSHVMLDENGTYADVYDANYTFVNGALAQHYGIPGVTGSAFQKVSTNDRGGLLLSGAYLSFYADPNKPNPIRRAKAIREEILCQDIPPPPPGVSTSRDQKEGELGAFFSLPTTTNRMRFHRLTESGSCRNCHTEVLNPLGFGLEDFDTVGRNRLADAKGNTIDASGAVFSPFLQIQLLNDPERDATHETFVGGKGLADLLARGKNVSETAKACLAAQMLSLSVGVDAFEIAGESNGDAALQASLRCDVLDMVSTLETQSPRAMLAKLATLESIRFRRSWSQ